MLVDTLHYAKSSLTWVFSRRFSVPLSMLGGSEICIATDLRRKWGSKDLMCWSHVALNWLDDLSPLYVDKSKRGQQSFGRAWFSMVSSTKGREKKEGSFVQFLGFLRTSYKKDKLGWKCRPSCTRLGTKPIKISNVNPLDIYKVLKKPPQPNKRTV